MNNATYTPEQIRFAEVWQRLKEGKATPEETEWMLETQTEYNEN